MDRIRYCASVVLFRALAFATLGIATLMVGLSWNPGLALVTGAVVTAIVGMALLYKGAEAPRRDYRKTELWLLLDKWHGLQEDRAQQVIGTVLGTLYKQSAQYVLIAATIQWLLSIAARLA